MSGKDGFAMHGIDHLSASQINCFGAQPSLWVLEKLMKQRPHGGIGVAANRGMAVEGGVEIGLFEPTMPMDECIAHALREYDRMTAFKAGEARDRERLVIPPMVHSALSELREYGVPSVPDPEIGRQHKIEMYLDGISVPVIGFLDFVFDRHGIIVDLKTTNKMPGRITDAHGRQGAIYARAHGNYEVRFLYTTGKKLNTYRLEDVAGHINGLTQIALRMERLLRLSSDPREIAAIVSPPDFGSFWWSDPETREAGRLLYGF